MELISSKFIRETSMTLFDDVLVHVSIGKSYEVKFNFEYCWSIRKKYKPKTLTMIHIHPDGCLWTSTKDRNMVKGWSLAFYIPIIFIVITNVGKNKYGFVKQIVKIVDDKPTIFTVEEGKIDVENNILNSFELKLLIFASRDLLLSKFCLYLLNKKMNKKIKLNKLLL